MFQRSTLSFSLPCFISVSFAPRLPELVAYIGEFTLELILWIMSLAKLLPVGEIHIHVLAQVSLTYPGLHFQSVLHGQRNTVKILLWDGTGLSARILLETKRTSLYRCSLLYCCQPVSLLFIGGFNDQTDALSSLLLSEVLLSIFVGEGESVLSSITAPMILGVVCVLSSRQILHLRDHVSGRSLMETRWELATDLTESRRSGVYHDM